MAQAECERCGEVIPVKQRECPECGNDPIHDGAILFIEISLAVGVGSFFFPPAIFLSVFMLLAAILLWAGDKANLSWWQRHYSPTNLDLDLP